MKKTTNAIQEHYMKAKAILETLEAREKEVDRQYIRENGIKNPDGSTPDQVYCIEDETTFEIANAAVAEITEKSGLWSEILAAREVLKIAEAMLIEYGLSIAPARERAVLKEAVKTNYTVRQKVIDLVFRLDVSTVRV